ncbi:MAG: hypothetical protein WAZ77_22925 [Candidatus Nitrosopolaris sp.]
MEVLLLINNQTPSTDAQFLIKRIQVSHYLGDGLVSWTPACSPFVPTMFARPGTANVFRNMLGLPEAKWEGRGGEQEQEVLDDLDVKQSALSDFLD